MKTREEVKLKAAIAAFGTAYPSLQGVEYADLRKAIAGFFQMAEKFADEAVKQGVAQA